MRKLTDIQFSVAYCKGMPDSQGLTVVAYIKVETDEEKQFSQKMFIQHFSSQIATATKDFHN